jgi:hypothetical protein
MHKSPGAIATEEDKPNEQSRICNRLQAGSEEHALFVAVATKMLKPTLPEAMELKLELLLSNLDH